MADRLQDGGGVLTHRHELVLRVVVPQLVFHQLCRLQTLRWLLFPHDDAQPLPPFVYEHPLLRVVSDAFEANSSPVLGGLLLEDLVAAALDLGLVLVDTPAVLLILRPDFHDPIFDVPEFLIGLGLHLQDADGDGPPGLHLLLLEVQVLHPAAGDLLVA